MPARKPRGAFALRVDLLEPRTLLSGDSPNELFVKFNGNASSSAIQAAFSTVGATVEQRYADGTDLISLGSASDASRALAWLKADPSVDYAEADGTLVQSSLVPNDPEFPQQWGLNNPNNVDIDAPEAWGATTGNPSTIVAILDTGIDVNNPAFAGRLWVNPAAGADGYSGDVNGWNFVGNNNNIKDDDGHGTHVAGILAATGNDGNGVAGVNWNAQIMVVKVLDSSGNGSTDQAVSGIYYAVQHGAKVINASWGGGPYSEAMKDAIAYAGSMGVVFVTAAGNDGANADASPSYPGSYNLPNEISVAAVDQNGNLAPYSDYGPQTIALAAPGSNIFSTIPNGFATYSGTSMATPYVSGVISLVAGLEPGYTAQQLIARVESTTKTLPSLIGKTITGGIVDAAAAVNPSTLLPPSLAPSTPTLLNFSTPTPTPTPTPTVVTPTPTPSPTYSLPLRRVPGRHVVIPVRHVSIPVRVVALPRIARREVTQSLERAQSAPMERAW
jgi:thermitase